MESKLTDSSPTIPAPDLLTREAVATRLALSVCKVDRLIASRELRAVRIGRAVRVRAADLARFIEKLETVK